MGILGNIKNAFFGEDKTTVNTGSSDQSDVRNRILKLQFLREKQDVQKWREAIQQAENPYFPYRTKMQRIFIDTTLDEHVGACMLMRKDLVLLKNREVLTKDGKIDEYWTEIFNGLWFDHFLNYALEALAFGYSVINFRDIQENKPKSIDLLPRQNFMPDKGLILKFPDTFAGIKIDNDQIKDWIIYVDTPSDFGMSSCGYGYLYKVAKSEILMRNNIGNNADYNELFGQPIRKGTTMKTDPAERDDYADRLSNMGSSPVIVIDNDEELELIESRNSGTGHQTYSDLEQRLEKRISKIILGHADALDSVPGKLGGKDDSVKNALEAREKSDVKFVLSIVNDVFIPKLRNVGVNIPEGYRLAFSNNKEIEENKRNAAEQASKVADFVDKFNRAGFEIDPSVIEELTGVKVTKKEIETPEEKLPEDVINKIKNMYGR